MSVTATDQTDQTTTPRPSAINVIFVNRRDKCISSVLDAMVWQSFNDIGQALAFAHQWIAGLSPELMPHEWKPTGPSGEGIGLVWDDRGIMAQITVQPSKILGMYEVLGIARPNWNDVK